MYEHMLMISATDMKTCAWLHELDMRALWEPRAPCLRHVMLRLLPVNNNVIPVSRWFDRQKWESEANLILTDVWPVQTKLKYSQLLYMYSSFKGRCNKTVPKYRNSLHQGPGVILKLISLRCHSPHKCSQFTIQFFSYGINTMSNPALAKTSNRLYICTLSSKQLFYFSLR